MKNASLRVKLIEEISTSNEALNNMQDIAAKGHSHKHIETIYHNSVKNLMDELSELHTILVLFDNGELSNKQLLLLANNQFNQVL